MKFFGSLTDIIAAVFRKDSQAITLRPNQSTTYTAARDIQLAPGDTAHVLVSETATQTLTNKTLTSPAITTPTGIVKGDVGLGNVDNTSDATKNAAVATLTNKTLTSPVINSPTGIVKADVGLGNVDNTSDATKNAAAATLTNKTIDGNSNTLTVLAGTQLSGTTPIANGGTGQATATAAFNALDPTTTKGDLIVNNGTDAIRLPVGTDNQILVADSAQTAGVKWAANSAGSTATPTSVGLTSSYFPTIQSAIKSAAADYTVTTTDGYSAILVTTGATDRTITLPAASSNTGRILTIKKVDSGIGGLTIARAGTDTIDGATSLLMAAAGQGAAAINSWVTLLSDGSNWKIIADKIHTMLYVIGTVGSTAAGSVIVFPTVQDDSHLAYSAGRYTTPFSGIYQCSIGGQGANASVTYGVYKNGSLVRRIACTDAAVGDGGGSISVSVTAGDILDFRSTNAVTGVIAATGWITIARIR